MDILKQIEHDCDEQARRSVATYAALQEVRVNINGIYLRTPDAPLRKLTVERVVQTSTGIEIVVL